MNRLRTYLKQILNWIQQENPKTRCDCCKRRAEVQRYSAQDPNGKKVYLCNVCARSSLHHAVTNPKDVLDAHLYKAIGWATNEILAELKGSVSFRRHAWWLAPMILLVVGNIYVTRRHAENLDKLTSAMVAIEQVFEHDYQSNGYPLVIQRPDESTIDFQARGFAAQKAAEAFKAKQSVSDIQAN